MSVEELRTSWYKIAVLPSTRHGRVYQHARPPTVCQPVTNHKLTSDALTQIAITGFIQPTRFCCCCYD